MKEEKKLALIISLNQNDALESTSVAHSCTRLRQTGHAVYSCSSIEEKLALVLRQAD
jgi:hypothetical protein